MIDQAELRLNVSCCSEILPASRFAVKCCVCTGEGTPTDFGVWFQSKPLTSDLSLRKSS